MENYSVKQIENVSLRMDNSTDVNRVYEIEARVNFQQSGNSFDGGIIKKDGVHVASFSNHVRSQNVNWIGEYTLEEKHEAQAAIDGFIKGLEGVVPNVTI